MHYADGGSLDPISALVQWDSLVIEACDKIGRTCSPGPGLKQWMIDAGFQNVYHKVFKVPFGPWPKDKKLVRIAGRLFST